MNQDLYIKGELYLPRDINVPKRPIPKLAEVRWTKPFKPTKKIWDDTKFKRFTTGRYFRQWGKGRILKRLRILPGDYIEEMPTRFLKNIPQPPFGFPELSGLSGLSENITTEPQRGAWGELTSILTKAGEWFTTVKKAQYEKEAELARARIAEAQATIAKYLKPEESNLLPILGIAGAGILTFYLLKRR